MPEDICDFVFYFDRKIPIDRFVDLVSDLVGFRILADLEFASPEEYDDGWVSCESFEGDFPYGYFLSYRIKKTTRMLESHQIARQIACNLKASVLTDLPSTHPDVGHPDSWCLVKPNGTCWKCVEGDPPLEGVGLTLSNAAATPLPSIYDQHQLGA